jgi:hypothetical protein
MGQISLDCQRRESVGLGPSIGLYSCIFCDRCFGTKPQLKSHYHNKHGEIIPNYEGNIVDTV